MGEKEEIINIRFFHNFQYHLESLKIFSEKAKSIYVSKLSFIVKGTFGSFSEMKELRDYRACDLFTK